MTPFRHPAILSATAGVLAALVMGACQWGARVAAADPVAPKTPAPAQKDLRPDADPGPDALLKAGSHALRAKVERKPEGGGVALHVTVDGAPVEVERYGVSPEAFTLREAASNVYDPPIRLLSFPMGVGDAWDWKGTMREGDRSREATAKVVSSPATLFLPSKADALRVDVTLQMDSGGPERAERKLSFWFVEGRGVVRREFGFELTREPYLPDGPADKAKGE